MWSNLLPRSPTGDGRAFFCSELRQLLCRNSGEWESHGSCCTAHQFKFPCQHYWAALLSIPDHRRLAVMQCQDEEELHEKIFHRAYLMKNVRSALEGVDVGIPCLDDVAHDGTTKPPPESFKANLGKRKLDKRILSQGEDK